MASVRKELITARAAVRRALAQVEEARPCSVELSPDVLGCRVLPCVLPAGHGPHQPHVSETPGGSRVVWEDGRR